MSSTDKDNYETLKYSHPILSGMEKKSHHERWLILTEKKAKMKGFFSAFENDLSSGSADEQKANATAEMFLLAHTRDTAFTMIKKQKSANAMITKLKDRYGISEKDEEQADDLYKTWQLLVTMTSNP